MTLPAIGSFIVDVNTTASTWVDITSPLTSVGISRSDGDVGTLSVNVRDAALDPTTSSTLRFGRKVRFRAKNGSGWKTLYVGTIATINVTYGAKTGLVSIDLTAQDNVAYLANVPESRGVGAVNALRWLMSGVGVDFVINGASTTLGAQTIVATNDSTSLWDQILIVRDSALGFAWVDQADQLIVCDAAHLSTTPKATLDTDVYSDIEIDFNSDSIINSVTVNYQRYDIGNETTTEIPYGPYENSTSIAQWGRYSSTVSLQGITEDPTAIAAYANSVIARNKDGQVRAKQATVPINVDADLAYAYYDLGDVLTVVYPDGTTGNFRVIGVEHTITPDPARFGLKWLVTYTFDIPLALNLPTTKPGTGISVIPPNSVGTPELKPGSVTIDEVAFSIRDLGGTTSFYGPTSPVGAIEGDLWYDTDADPTVLSRWDGSAWVALTSGTPTTSPAESPTIRAFGDSSGITLVADNIDPTSVLDWYVDGVLTTEPQGNGSRSTVVRLTLDSTGAPFVDGNDYAFHVIARNVVGSAAASPDVSAALNQGVSAEFVMARVIAGFVLAGAIQVGNITIDPDTGITIPLADGGLIQFPADGSPAVITALLTAYQLTVVDYLTILGSNNVLSGVLSAQSATTAPRNAPQVSQLSSGINRAVSGLPTTSAPVALLDWSSTTWRVVTASGKVYSVVKSTGVATLAGTISGIGSGQVTSATVLGTTLYVGVRFPSESDLHTYSVSGSFVATAVPLVFTGAPAGTIGTIGTDGTNLLFLGWGGLTVFTTGGTVTASISGPPNGASRPMRGSFDYGANRLIYITGGTVVHSATVSGSTATEQGSEQFTGSPATILGLAYDGTGGYWWRLVQGSSGYVLNQYSDQRTAVTGRSITVTYAHGATPAYESKPSPATVVNQAARSWLKIVGPSLPASPGASDPDRIGVYVGNQRQLYTATGVNNALIGTTASGSAAPTTEGFPQGTLGTFASQAVDGNGPLIQLNGDGSYRLAGATIDEVAWTNLTHQGTGGSVRWCCRNGVVYMQLNSSITVANNTVVTVVNAADGIPSGYRPSTVGVNAGGSSNGRPATITCATNGAVTIFQNSGSSQTTAYGLLSWPKGT